MIQVVLFLCLLRKFVQGGGEHAKDIIFDDNTGEIIEPKKKVGRRR